MARQPGMVTAFGRRFLIPPARKRVIVAGSFPAFSLPLKRLLGEAADRFRPRRLIILVGAPGVDLFEKRRLDAYHDWLALSCGGRAAFFPWYHGLTFHQNRGITDTTGRQGACQNS
jgi:hypothetical protein